MRLSHSRRRPNPHPRCIIVHADHIYRALELAEDALPVETGGILVGYRTADAIVVADALEVPDSNSSPTSYRRDQELAQVVLDERLRHEPRSSYFGFVGDWHSHTRNARASIRDLKTLRTNTASDGDSLALIVIAHVAPGWQSYGYVTRRPVATRRPRPLRSVRVLEVPIVDQGESQPYVAESASDTS